MSLLENKFIFCSILIEKKVENIIPDVIIWDESDKIHIEILVTHKVDVQKIEKIVKLGIKVIEIDLSKFNDFHDLNLFTKTILLDSKLKKWIHHPLQEKLKMIAKKFRKQRHIQYNKKYMEHRLYDCPIKKEKGFNFATIEYDCKKCKYMASTPLNYNDFYHEFYCTGDSKLEIENEIKNLFNIHN